MKVDIGRVFSNTWEMIKQRFWLLLGMWAVYLGIQIVFGMVFGGILGGSMFALGAGAGGLDDPAMLGGLGIGVILLMIIFYFAYIVLMVAQQCSMTALATPMFKLRFGEAIKVGAKGGLTFLGIILAFLVAYFAFAIVAGIFVGILSVMGETVAGVMGVIVALLFLPVIIFLAMRLSVLVPVVAVDRVFNPITAIQKTWAMTKGNVLAIFVIYIVVGILAMVLVALPFGMIFGSMAAIGTGGDSAGAVAAIFGSLFLFFPLFLVYSIVAITIVACLHSELSDTGTQSVEDTFG